MRRLDQFADLLAHHDAFASPPQPGGNAAEAAKALGSKNPRVEGNAMLQRLRRDLGPQAR